MGTVKTIALCIAAFALGQLTMMNDPTWGPVERVTPALIAHGCDGAGGDVWVMEESDLPTMCKDIENWTPVD